MNYKGEELYDPEDLGDYLAHYGRKGMKWYQHIFGDFQSGAKYAKGKGKSTQKKAATKPEKPAQKTKEKKPSHKKMSDEDLKKRIDRLTLEKQYLDLTRDTRTKGKKLVDRVLDIAEKSAFDIAQQTLTNLGKKYVYQYFDVKISDYLKSQKDKKK